MKKNKILIVVDMQNDFISGTLPTYDKEVVKNVVAKVEQEQQEGTSVIFTMDTHNENYLNTQEGKNLPIPHCLYKTEGWNIIPELADVKSKCKVFLKDTFGSNRLIDYITHVVVDVEEIELIGVCTDICVISNALLLKSACPELVISVDSKCCAGVTPEKHEAALEAMRSCQINVK